MNKIIIDPHNCSRAEFKGLKKYLEENSWDFKEIEPEVDTKTQKISKIKEIIEKWGETSTAELEAGFSPCISSTGNRPNTSVLVERFSLNDVGVFTYVGEIETAENDMPYEDLSEDVIDEILDLLEDYDVDNQKTFDRCQN